MPNMAKQYCLPLDVCGKETHQRILRQCAIIKKLRPVVFIVPLIAYSTLLPLVDDQEDIQFTVMFIKKYTGIWSTFLQVLYYFCIISLGHAVGCLCVICLYMTLHLKFQLILLIEYLNHISSDYKPDIEDEFYQNIIHIRLRSFVQAHNNFKE